MSPHRALLLLATVVLSAGCEPVNYDQKGTVVVNSVPWANEDRVAAERCAPRQARFVQIIEGTAYRPERKLYICE